MSAEVLEATVSKSSDSGRVPAAKVPYTLRYLVTKHRRQQMLSKVYQEETEKELVDVSCRAPAAVVSVLQRRGLLGNMRALWMRHSAVDITTVRATAESDDVLANTVVLDLSGNGFVGVEGGEHLVAMAKRAKRLYFICADDSNVPPRLLLVSKEICFEKFMAAHAFVDELALLGAIYVGNRASDNLSWRDLTVSVSRHSFSPAHEIPHAFAALLSQRWARCLTRHRQRAMMSCDGISDEVCAVRPTLLQFVLAALPPAAARRCEPGRFEAAVSAALRAQFPSPPPKKSPPPPKQLQPATATSPQVPSVGQRGSMPNLLCQLAQCYDTLCADPTATVDKKRLLALFAPVAGQAWEPNLPSHWLYGKAMLTLREAAMLLLPVVGGPHRSATATAAAETEAGGEVERAVTEVPGASPGTTPVPSPDDAPLPQSLPP